MNCKEIDTNRLEVFGPLGPFFGFARRFFAFARLLLGWPILANFRPIRNCSFHARIVFDVSGQGATDMNAHGSKQEGLSPTTCHVVAGLGLRGFAALIRTFPSLTKPFSLDTPQRL